MPVSFWVDNDLRLFVHLHYGKVTKGDLTDLVYGLAKAVSNAGMYRGLAIFGHDTDLSELDVAALNAVREESKAAFQRLGIARGESVAVVAGPQAQMIMPLWNALCDTDAEFDHSFTLCSDLPSALAILGIPEEKLPQFARIATDAPD